MGGFQYIYKYWHTSAGGGGYVGLLGVLWLPDMENEEQLTPVASRWLIQHSML